MCVCLCVCVFTILSSYLTLICINTRTHPRSLFLPFVTSWHRIWHQNKENSERVHSENIHLPFPFPKHRLINLISDLLRNLRHQVRKVICAKELTQERTTNSSSSAVCSGAMNFRQMSDGYESYFPSIVSLCYVPSRLTLTVWLIGPLAKPYFELHEDLLHGLWSVLPLLPYIWFNHL